MLNKEEMERAFLAIIQLVKDDLKGMEALEESTAMKNPKWDQALPSHICVVLEEFDDVFPQDLPLGLPPVHQGHEFRIDLEDDVPRFIAPYTR